MTVAGKQRDRKEPSEWEKLIGAKSPGWGGHQSDDDLEDDLLPRVTQKDETKKGHPYEVVYKRIAIRASPDASGKILGNAVAGEELQLYEWDRSGVYRETYINLNGIGERVKAWVMVRHLELGTLLKPKLPMDAISAALVMEANRSPNQPVEVLVETSVVDADTVEAKTQDNCKNCGFEVAIGAKFCPNCGAKMPDAAPPSADPKAPVQGVRWPLPPLSGAAISAAIKELKQKQSLMARRVTKQPKSEWEQLMEGSEERQYRREDSDEEADELPEYDAMGGVPFKDADIAELERLSMRGGVRFEVAARQGIVVRHMPTHRGYDVSTVDYGQVLDTFGKDKSENWRRVFCQCKVSRKIVEAWVNMYNVHNEPVLQALA
mmetsp:Transcript_60682/g.130304  ORF Transcript_60682/g.130304 Transcript_60682/m.130304 type:complete len:377 (-) Transcript_60682:117-1247(-)